MKLKIMKQIIITAMFVLMPMLAMTQPSEQSQDGPRFDPQRFEQMVEQTLTKAGELSPDEARTFFPLYKEMREKQRTMGREVHELKCSHPADAKACSATIAKIKRLQVEMAELEQSYYKRFLRVVSPEKLFRMMKAEDDFHRRMVRGERGKRGQRGGNKEQRGTGEHRGNH